MREQPPTGYSTRQMLVWTRPRPPSDAERAALAEAGLDCLLLPLLGARREKRTPALWQQLRAAAEAAMRIYVSVEAVQAVAELAPGLLTLPSAAVGPQTAASLQQAGCSELWQPANGLGAEALLALPQWRTIAARPVALLHAPGGVIEPFRRLPGLCPIIVYRRYRRALSVHAIAQLRNRLHQAILLGPSALIVEALADELRRQRLDAGFSRPLLVLSERVRARARALAFADVRVCGGLDAVGLLSAL